MIIVHFPSTTPSLFPTTKRASTALLLPTNLTKYTDTPTSTRTISKMLPARALCASTLQKRSFHSANLRSVISTNRVFETKVVHPLDSDKRTVNRDAKFQATSPTVIPAAVNARTAWQDYRKNQVHQIQTLSLPFKGAFYSETPSTPASSSPPSVEKPSEAAPSTTFKLDREMQARTYKQELFLDETEGDLLWYKHWLGLGGWKNV